MYGGQMMEVASTTDLFANVRHPYTEALLNSIPRPDLESHARLQPIEGWPPDMVSPPSGCRFAARCRYAQPRCLTEVPELTVRSDDGHETRCFFPVDTDAGRAALAANIAAGTTASGLEVRSEVMA
jgi:peptide/nickel transport system ATP-binding protein